MAGTCLPSLAEGRSEDCPTVLRVHARELGTQQQNLARVVHPQQQDHHRTGGAVAGRHAALAEIEADQLLPDCEEHGGDKCTGGDITPAERHVRQNAVEQREERCRR